MQCPRPSIAANSSPALSLLSLPVLRFRRREGQLRRSLPAFQAGSCVHRRGEGVQHRIQGGPFGAKADAAWNRLHMKIRPLRESIEEQPVTLSSLVDRAIVAAHDCSPGKDWTDQPGIVSLVRAVCGLAGVDPAEAML